MARHLPVSVMMPSVRELQSRDTIDHPRSFDNELTERLKAYRSSGKEDARGWLVWTTVELTGD